MNDEIIAITFFLSLTTCIIVPLYLRYKLSTQKLATLLKLLEGNSQFTPDMLGSMLEQGSGPTGDLRKGLIFVGISIPLFIASMIDGEYVMAAVVGGVPFFTGVAFLLVMRFGYRKELQEKHHSV